MAQKFRLDSLGEHPTLYTAHDEGIVFEDGEVVADRFRVVRAIGGGGMGLVYQVADTMMGNQNKAMKVILPSLTKSERAQQHFIQEAQVAQQLSHPNIVNTYDLGIHEGRRFITMEYLDGGSLWQWLTVRKTLSFTETLAVLEQVMEGLAYAHRKTVHRDIKPQNIFICADSTIKLLDFGLARVIGAQHFTRSSVAVGTAAYMAPEQLQGGEASARSDLYSVGVVAYQCMTGELPLGRFKLPGELDDSVPEWVDDLIEELLQPMPTKRPASAESLKARIAEGRSRKARPRPAQSPAVQQEGRKGPQNRQPAPYQRPKVSPPAKDRPPAIPEFLLEAEWEYDAYPAQTDSFVCGLLRVQSNSDCRTESRVASHLIFLLDLSGSMNQPKKYPLLREALTRLMERLEEHMFLTLIVFSDWAQCACKVVSGTQLKSRAKEVIAWIDAWPYHFHMTNLSLALTKAIEAVREGRQRQPDAATRVYILTDGEVSDPEETEALLPEFQTLDVEINAFGFGDESAYATLRDVVRASAGGTIKQIRNTEDIQERFLRVAEVASLLRGTGVRLELTFAHGVIPGDFFAHRPTRRFWKSAEDWAQVAPSFDVGVIEAGRTYVWAMEARLPEHVDTTFELGRLRLSYRRGDKPRTCEWPIQVPVTASAVPRGNEEVKLILASLEDLRDESVGAKIKALDARVAVCKAEGRGWDYIKEMEERLSRLRAEERRQRARGVNLDSVTFSDLSASSDDGARDLPEDSDYGDVVSKAGRLDVLPPQGDFDAGAPDSGGLPPMSDIDVDTPDNGSERSPFDDLLAKDDDPREQP